MPILSVRLSEQRLDDLKVQAHRSGVSVAQMVRDALFGDDREDEHLVALERRVSRLEEMAGL